MAAGPVMPRADWKYPPDDSGCIWCKHCGKELSITKHALFPYTGKPNTIGCEYCNSELTVLKLEMSKIYDGSCSRCGEDSDKITDKGLDQLCPKCLTDTTVGYHLATIKKGKYGEPSKILEEAEELMDAHDQKAKIMALHELSDLYGAMKAYLQKYHPGYTMNDVEVMSNLTSRAFQNGHR